MSNIHRLRILLGVSAGIAAYKAVELARLLVKAGAEVRVVMTPAAHEFIGALSLQAVTGHAVRDSLFDPSHEAAMGHIELARWAQRILIAPATADCLAKLAAGSADTLLHTLCLASPAPLAVAPAMNQQMWRHPATQANVAVLAQRGVAIWGPDEGAQACGDVGPGRMLEPAALLSRLLATPTVARLAGYRVLVTAGPTREAIDPVRFVGNRSSGKMGYAVAAACAAAGGEVVLVSGPVGLATPPGVRRVNVETAAQMRTAVFSELPGCAIFIACAAVADYRPLQVAAEKIKKGAAELTLQLIRNPDILAEVAATAARPFCVGFAAETHDVEAYADGKRRAKGLDMIAANLVGEGGLGFESDDNALLVLWQGGRHELARAAKTELARELVTLIADRFDAQTTA